MRQTFHFLLMKFCFEQLKTQLPLRSGFFFSSKHLKMSKWDDLTELFSGFCSKPIFGNFIFTEKIGHPTIGVDRDLKSSWFFFQPIDYTSTRGGVSVLTNKAETTVSSLIIQKASVSDGGVYSCQAGQIEPTSIKIHVLTGE